MSFPRNIIVILSAMCAAVSVAHCRRQARPNILLVTFDTARADAFGAYGARTGATPAVDRLASEGVVFDQASTPVPLTLPAHASLLTGAFPPRHSIRENGTHGLPAEMVTLAELLRDSGYRTGAFVGAFVLDARWGLNQGFDTYSGSFETSSADVFSLADLQRRADRVADEAVRWLEQRSERPFFAWVHFYDPHSPFDPPEEFRRRFEHPYAAEIAYADSQLARLVQSLDGRGKLKNTIIAFAADHGEGFGEHGENGHGLLLYEESLHVPLIVRAPGRMPAGKRVTTPVSLVDVFPMLAELAAVPIPAAVQGHSLVPLIERDQEHDTTIYAETLYPRARFNWSPLRVLRSGPLKLIASSQPELYDIEADPGEKRDLARERDDLLRRNLRRLKSAMEELGRDPAKPLPTSADSEIRAKLAALGYIAGPAQRRDVTDDALPPPRTKIQTFEQLARARGDLASGAVAGAEAKLLAITRAEPEMLEGHVALGELYLRSRRPLEAAQAFRKALAISSADPSLLAAMATAELQSGRPEEALRLLETAMAQVPGEPRFHFVAGRAWLIRGELGRGKQEFEAMLRLNPRAVAALVELAGIAIAEAEPARARTLASSALNIDPRAKGARLFLAQALEAAGEHEEAWRTARAELAISPDDFRVPYYLAELATRLGHHEEIEPNLRRAIALEPRFAKSYLALAKHLLDRGVRFDEGLRLAQTAIDLKVTGKDEVLAHFLLADFYSRLGRHDLSRRHAVRARQIGGGR